jgi:hypothetical protein
LVMCKIPLNRVNPGYLTQTTILSISQYRKPGAFLNV